MLSIKIKKGNTSVCFDAPTDVLYDRLAFVGVKDIPISGTDEATVKIYTWDDEKLSDMIKERLSDSDKMSEVCGAIFRLLNRHQDDCKRSL